MSAATTKTITLPILILDKAYFPFQRLRISINDPKSPIRKFVRELQLLTRLRRPI